MKKQANDKVIKGFIIVSYGDNTYNDYVGRIIYLSKNKAIEHRDKMQKECDDDRDNFYDFIIEEVEIID